MVVYHVITMFHLLSSIVHKLTFHSNEEAVLIIPDFMSDKIEIERFEEIKENGFFMDVFTFPYRKLGKNEKEIRNNVLLNYNQYFGSIRNKEIKYYLYGAHFYFSLALINNRINYDVFEEATGAYTHQQILNDAVEKSNKVMEKIGKKYNTFGYTNEFISNVWIDYSAQEGVFSTEKTIHFSVTEKLKNLEREKMELLLKFFRVPCIFMNDDAVILLTQHFMNLNIMSYEEQALIYKTFIDIFYPDSNMYIKPHPDDFMDYQNKIGSCKIIRGKFPIELLPYVGGKSANTVATIYSTAIYTVKDYFKESLVLDMTYRESYKFAYQYYVVGAFVNFLYRFSHDWNCKMIGTDVKHFNAIMELNFDIRLCYKEQKDNSIYIIDDLVVDKNSNNISDSLINMDDNNIFIFINSKKKYQFFDNNTDCLEFMIPIKIEINQSNYDKWKQREEIIYIFTKNKLWKEAMEEMSLHKELKNLEQVIDVRSLSKEEIKIHVLEGILHATEQRLLESLKEKENEDNEDSRDYTSTI